MYLPSLTLDIKQVVSEVIWEELNKLNLRSNMARSSCNFNALLIAHFKETSNRIFRASFLLASHSSLVSPGFLTWLVFKLFWGRITMEWMTPKSAIF